MPLVDYASDSDSDPASTPNSPPRKKPKTAPSSTSTPTSGSGSGSNPLPPLPATFHDLYASTVRTTTRDEPSLHQGRTRQTPHTPGAWPSHVYIEWHPPAETHALLSSLITSLQTEIGLNSNGSGETEEDENITSFLQSDLATPQPLHISLSRPLVLSQGEKDAFLHEVQDVLTGSGTLTAGFVLRCGRVEWHRTEESGRSFLVLRVHTSSSHGRIQSKEDGENLNPELTELLRRCNGVVAKYGQPELYQWAEGEGERVVGDAFHVSIAWSFAKPTGELERATERVFGEPGVRERIEEVEIPVEGVKVKIGNVVTHVALPQPGRRKATRNLLGL